MYGAGCVSDANIVREGVSNGRLEEDSLPRPSGDGSELVFANPRAEVKTLIDSLKTGYSLDGFLEKIPHRQP